MTVFDIPEALADDPEILDAAKKLILSSISAAQELVDEGIPSVKMSVIRSLLPAAVKLASRQKNVDEEIEELRREIQSLYAEILGHDDEETESAT